MVSARASVEKPGDNVAMTSKTSALASNSGVLHGFSFVPNERYASPDRIDASPTCDPHAVARANPLTPDFGHAHAAARRSASFDILITGKGSGYC